MCTLLIHGYAVLGFNENERATTDGCRQVTTTVGMDWERGPRYLGAKVNDRYAISADAPAKRFLFTLAYIALVSIFTILSYCVCVCVCIPCLLIARPSPSVVHRYFPTCLLTKQHTIRSFGGNRIEFQNVPLTNNDCQSTQELLIFSPNFLNFIGERVFQVSACFRFGVYLQITHDAQRYISF